MSPQRNRDEAAALASQWLDRDDSSTGEARSASPGAGDSKAAFADQLVIDAILTSHSATDRARCDATIQKIMKQIGDETPSRRAGLTRIRILIPSIAVAACLLIVGTLFLTSMMRVSYAKELLREVALVSRQPIDLVYSVSRQLPNAEPVAHAVGKLYLRGTVGFVLVCPDATLGRHPHGVWIVPEDGPVVLARDFAEILDGTPIDLRELTLLNDLSAATLRAPLMELTAILDLMEHHYRVSLRPAETLRGENCEVLVGELLDAHDELPAVIQLWVDRESKIIRQAQIEWNQAAAQRSRLQLTFQHLPDEVVSDAWYEHTMHHDESREIRIIGGGRRDIEP